MRCLALALALSSVAASAAAQVVGPGDPILDYLRVLQISGAAVPGSFAIDPRSPAAGDAPTGSSHPWRGRFAVGGTSREGVHVEADGAVLRAFVNSSHPDGGNDGAVWQGRGVTAAFDVGATLRWRGLEVSLGPTVAVSQNASFDMAAVAISGMSQYAYPWRRIDLPQRQGPDAVWTLDPGQSEIAVTWGVARVGFGTRNLRWGPARRNPIVMSRNAPGFPHATLGTSAPIETRIGRLEAEWIWGRLGQTEWADPSLPTDDRFFTGIVLAYSPSFLDGLSVGFTRAFQRLVPSGGVPFGDYFGVFQGFLKSGLTTEGNPSGTDVHDQLVSLFARWALPESGFEAYIEWARNDHSWDLADLIQEPEHSRGYTLGFQKVTAESTDRLIVLSGEFTTLEASPTFQLRGRPTFYEHSVVTQGYTHEGQLLGAPVGPGGSAQQLGLDGYERWGGWGLSVQRRVHDNDAFWVWAQANGLSFDRHHVSVDLGARTLYFLENLELDLAPTLTRELNRYFDDDEGWNLNVRLSLRWRPGASGP